jgi:hypothetical protein
MLRTRYGNIELEADPSGGTALAVGGNAAGGDTMGGAVDRECGAVGPVRGLLGGFSSPAGLFLGGHCAPSCC